MGAAAGAIAGKFSDVGVDDEFIMQVSNTIQLGNSAIFLLIQMDGEMIKNVDS